jgi:hypothetical protein
MSKLPNVVIVIGRCNATRQSFGLRVEERTVDNWVANWSFVIKEALAHKEGYDRSVVRGSFSVGTAYPGCPHCHNPGFFQCSCGKVGCWDGTSNRATCGWCAKTVTLGGQITNLNVGADR